MDIRDEIREILYRDFDFLVGTYDPDAVIDEWVATGLTSDEIEKWVAAEAWDPQAVVALRDAGITPEQAEKKVEDVSCSTHSPHTIARRVSEGTLTVEDARTELFHITLGEEHWDDDRSCAEGYDLRAGFNSPPIATADLDGTRLRIKILTYAHVPTGVFDTIDAVNEFLREYTRRTLTRDAAADLQDLIDFAKADVGDG